MRWYPDGDGRIALVMMGNPRIRGFAHRRPDGQRVEDLDVKANTVVAWIDRTRLGDAGVLSGLEGLDRKAASPDGTAPPEAAPPETSTPEPAPPGRSPPGSRTDASVLQEAVLGLYAEGAVELTYGDLAFRSERLYLEPPTYKALLLEPRFTAKGTPPRSPGAAHEDALRGAGAQGMTKTSPLEGLPLYVRARWARLVGKGVAVFDDSEVSVSRADDRLALEVGRLVVEEEQPAPGEAADGELGRVPTLLGFRRVPDQRYHAEGVELRGERVPLAYWGSATFSYPFEANLPVRVRRVTYGNRSSQGRYANVTLGGRAGPAGRPWFDWGVLVGGYSKRGPAAGADIEWDHDQTRGSAQLWGIYEFGRRDDASGFFAPHPFRWLAELESRSHVLPHTTFDAFVNDFSDAGVNLEYFENDALTEQDRESYVRTRWEQQLWVATLDAKWHQRSFVTETEELPQVDLWSSAVPLVVPGRKGAPSIDLLTHSRAGWLRRRVADGLTLPEPETARLATRTELGLGFDAGDVRISAYAGTDATEDLARTGRPSRLESAALVAGARAHLQLHRTWEVREAGSSSTGCATSSTWTPGSRGAGSEATSRWSRRPSTSGTWSATGATPSCRWRTASRRAPRGAACGTCSTSTWRTTATWTTAGRTSRPRRGRSTSGSGGARGSGCTSRARDTSTSVAAGSTRPSSAAGSRAPTRGRWARACATCATRPSRRSWTSRGVGARSTGCAYASSTTSGPTRTT